MTAHLRIGEHSPIQLDGYDSDRKRTPRGKKAQQWRGRSRFRNQDGTTTDITRWAATKEAAEQAVQNAIDDKVAGAVTGAKLMPGMPFVDAGKFWLQRIERADYRGPTGKPLSERSRAEYRGAYHRYIDAEGSPFRGMTLADANRVGRIRPVLEHIADTKGTQTARLARTVLAHILATAIRYGIPFDYNGARLCGAVQAKTAKEADRDRRRAMTRDERDKVIATADAKVTATTNPRSVAKWQTVADVVAFMAGTGVRIQEARLLEWTELDLSQGTAHVRGTKSASADRVVSMPAWLTERLERRQRAAKANAKAQPVTKPYGPYVFGYAPQEVIDKDGLRAMPGTNHPMDQSNLAGAVRVVLDEAGLTWAVPHSFRRTVASLLHEGSVPLVRIADQLGHSDASMTAKVYLGRDFKGDKSDLAALL